MLALLSEISLRHWIRSPLRSLLIVLGIALGVALYVATGAASKSMSAAFAELVARAAGRADLTIQSDSGALTSDLVGDVADVPGVSHAAATLELTTQALDYGESLLILGVDLLGDLHFLPFNVTQGEQRTVEDPLSFVNDPYAVLIAKRFAARHGLSTGSKLRLLTSEGPKDFHVRGVLEDSGPAASFGGQVIVMFLDAAQVAFSKGLTVDRIDVAVAPPASVDEVRARLVKRLRPGTSVERPDHLTAHLQELVLPLDLALSLSGFIALLVGGFLVYNAVGVAVAQRVREIGVLRALGVTRGRTSRLLCTEAAMLAVPAVAIGLILARYMARRSTAEALKLVNRVYLVASTSEPTLTPGLIVRGCVAGIATAVIAAWWPARRGAQSDPAIVLRAASSVERSKLNYLRLLLVAAALLVAAVVASRGTTFATGVMAITAAVFGAALATPAVVVLLRRLLVQGIEHLLGVPARLGLDNVERMLGRSTLNVLALMVAVSMSVFIGGWIGAFELALNGYFEQFGSVDLTIIEGSPFLDRSHVPMSPATMERVSRVQGVRTVQPVRLIEQRVGGRPFTLSATDTKTFFGETVRRGKRLPIVDGGPVSPNDLVEAPRIMISEAAAHNLKLRVGDHVTLHAPKEDVSFEVRAIMVDYSSPTGSGYIDRRYLVQYWGDEAIDALNIGISEGASADAVADRLRAELGSNVFVTHTDTVRQNLADTLADSFSYAHTVEIVTLLVALMGVVGTMIAAVIDRSREIGTLRAIGATRRQVRSAVVIEAGFLGLCAVLAGIGLGVLLGLLFLKTLMLAGTGWQLHFVFPWSNAGRIGGLAIVTSMAAGGVAASRISASDDLSGSVAYE